MSSEYVVSYSVQNHQIISDTLIAGEFYGIEVDEVSKNIFTLNAKHFAQNGDLEIYNSEGTLLETHQVEIIPGSVTFVYEKSE